MWIELKADEGATYDETIEIDLSKLEPLIALPHSPDNVKTVSELEGTPVDQVCIGSCTNSSLRDLKIVSALLKGKKVHENTSLTVSAGSRQAMENLAAAGELEPLHPVRRKNPRKLMWTLHRHRASPNNRSRITTHI